VSTDQLTPPDPLVCLCFRVSLRKLVHYLDRERPSVPSQLADCLGAGTGCQWCVPFLKRLHEQWLRGEPADLPVDPEEYADRRASYRQARRASNPPAPGGAAPT
jgi:bacterioferritin-associated ferredoxin